MFCYCAAEDLQSLSRLLLFEDVAQKKVCISESRIQFYGRPHRLFRKLRFFIQRLADTQAEPKERRIRPPLHAVAEDNDGQRRRSIFQVEHPQTEVLKVVARVQPDRLLELVRTLPNIAHRGIDGTKQIMT